MRKTRENVKVKYSPSKAIPGQALIPAELLKRHLAGTLPDIQKNPQFTHDENGQQISEDLSGLELHELHDLAVKLRREFDERQKQLKKQADEDYRKSIIDEHIKTQTAVLEKPPGTAAAGDGAAADSDTH